MQSTYRVIYDISKISQEIYIDDFIFDEIIITQEFIICNYFTIHLSKKKGNAKNIEQYYRYSLQYNCTQQLGKIKLPVLLIYGKDDKPFYDYAMLLHKKLPYAQLKFINHAKHQIPTKAANDLNEMIRQFIKGAFH